MVSLLLDRFLRASANCVRAPSAALAIAAALALPACAASRANDGEAIVEQDGASVCFRVATFKTPSLIAPAAQDVDRERVVASAIRVGRYDASGYVAVWGAADPADQLGRGIRLDRKVRWCYGKTPAGFSATLAAQPLSAGRYRVEIEAAHIAEPIEHSESADFASEFCLAGRAGELRLIPCATAGKPASP